MRDQAHVLGASVLLARRAMRRLLPALSLLLALGCSERVELVLADGAVPGTDANLDAARPDAPRPDAPIDIGFCTVRATDPPGITALGVDERFSTFTSRSGTTLFRGPLYWTGFEPGAPMWISWGPLAELLTDVPSLESRLPWDRAGITATDWDDVDGILFVSSNFYWRYVHDTSAITVGHVRELMPPEERRVDGALPWEGAGVTGISIETLRNAMVISGLRYFEFTSVGPDRWVASGHIDERWPDLPPNDGVMLWDPPGVTAYYAGNDATGQAYRILVNGDRYWEVDPSDSFRRLGLVSDRWPTVPVYEGGCP